MKNNKVLSLNSIINGGKFNKQTVNKVLKNNKRDIFSLIKEGFSFDNEVLQMAGIKKNIKNKTIKNEIVEHEKDTKVYEIDTTPLHKILKEISTIDNYSFTESQNKNDENFDEDVNDLDIDKNIELNDE